LFQFQVRRSFDGRLDDDHNLPVFGTVARAVAGLLVVPFLALASGLAPIHAHERETDHSHALVHSHFELHHQDADDHHGREIESDDGHVVWLDSTIFHAVRYQVDPPPVLVVAGIDSMAFTRSWTAIPVDPAAPIHGPPRRASSLRGPPSFPA
jgi:hypothetical protein